MILYSKIIPKLYGRGLLFPWIHITKFVFTEKQLSYEVQFMICPRQTAGAQSSSLSHLPPYPTSPITSKYIQGQRLVYNRNDWSLSIVWQDNLRLEMSMATYEIF